MTPQKEKANELVGKYKPILPHYNVNDNLEKAKQCALICVDEIIKHLPNINNTPPIKRNKECFYFQFWVGVKEEINKI